MATALDIIKHACKLIGVLEPGESMSSDDAKDGLETLNYVVDSWNIQGLALYNTVNITASLTGGKNPHTIGITGDINISRPIKIQRAFTRSSVSATNPVDFMMDPVDNDRYQEFAIKNISTTYPITPLVSFILTLCSLKI
jgi:hypothetical protein